MGACPFQLKVGEAGDSGVFHFHPQIHLKSDMICVKANKKHTFGDVQAIKEKDTDSAKEGWTMSFP